MSEHVRFMCDYISNIDNNKDNIIKNYIKTIWSLKILRYIQKNFFNSIENTYKNKGSNYDNRRGKFSDNTNNFDITEPENPDFAKM